MGLGLSIFSNVFSRFGDLTIFWVFVAYIVAITAVNIETLIYSSFSTKKTKEKAKQKKDNSKVAVKMDAEGEGEVELIEESSEPKEKEKYKEETEERKKPAVDSKYRWMFFGIFTVLNVAFLVAFIVLVALP